MSEQRLRLVSGAAEEESSAYPQASRYRVNGPRAPGVSFLLQPAKPRRIEAVTMAPRHTNDVRTGTSSPPPEGASSAAEGTVDEVQALHVDHATKLETTSQPESLDTICSQMLVKLRAQQGLTMQELAARIKAHGGTTASGHISLLERGLMGWSVQTLVQIMQGLDVGPCDLMPVPGGDHGRELIKTWMQNGPTGLIDWATNYIKQNFGDIDLATSDTTENQTTISGHIKTLSGNPTVGGIVGVSATINGKHCTIFVKLAGDVYKNAISAYASGSIVSLTGIITRGRKIHMDSVTSFQIGAINE